MPEVNLGEPRRLVVLTPLLTRDNGGSATAIDLVHASLSLGYDTSMLLTADGRWRHYLPSRNPSSLSFSLRHIYALEQVDRIPNDSGSSPAGQPSVSAWRSSHSVGGWVKKRAKHGVLLTERAWTRRSAQNALHTASVIVDIGGNLRRASSLGTGLRPDAALVFNHNGSMEQAAAAISRTRSLDSIDWDSYRATLRGYNTILLQSDDVAQQISEFDKDLGQRCVVLKPSSDEAAVLASLNSLSPFKCGERSVLIVGSVQPRKNQLAAIEALHDALRSGEITLHLVGAMVDQEYVRHVRKRVAELSIVGSVVMHGHRSDYLRYLAHCDVVVQPSLAEGVSRTLREAMLLAKPIVASAISGTMSTLQHDESALLVNPRDALGLRAAVGRVLDDDQLASRLGRDAQARYLQHNSWTNYLIGVRKLVELDRISVPESAS